MPIALCSRFAGVAWHLMEQNIHTITRDCASETFNDSLPISSVAALKASSWSSSSDSSDDAFLSAYTNPTVWGSLIFVKLSQIHFDTKTKGSLQFISSESITRAGGFCLDTSTG